jgi:hypothetical protein
MKRIDIVIIIQIIIGMLLMFPIHLFSALEPAILWLSFFGIKIWNVGLLVDFIIVFFLTVMFSAIICMLIKETKYYKR